MFCGTGCLARAAHDLPRAAPATQKHLSIREREPGGLLFADYSLRDSFSTNRGICHIREHEMKATTALCLAIALAAFAGPANAIFKCTTAKGVVYQDRPCRDGNESDINIVIPTGELAPRATAADDGATASNPRSDDRVTAPRATRSTGESSATATRRGSDAATNGAETSLRNVPTVVEKAAPVTADQARKTDPSAKYYATEGFNAGSDTPAQMNCESPSGEKRVFYLSNGKLTSI
jgi:hypothetical protein